MIEDVFDKVENVDNSLREFLPKKNDWPWINKYLKNYEGDLDSFNGIFEPIQDLVSRGGKRIRPLLMGLTYRACGGKENIEKFYPVSEIIHNGTLMIDDIEDNSDLRRGKPCIHKIYGVDMAINSGNLMYYLPNLIIKNSNLDAITKLKIYEMINEEMIKISFGQGMDIFWHNKGNVPTEKEYFQMCSYKTGCLLRIACGLGCILAGRNNEMVNAFFDFAEAIGIAFQIQDDVLNITNTEWGKDFGDDISEGKMTLIVVKTLEKAGEVDNKRLKEILRMHTKDKDLILEAIGILKKYGGIEYSLELARKLVIAGFNRVDKVLEDSEYKKQLREFTNYFVERRV